MERNSTLILQWIKAVTKPALAPTLLFVFHVNAYVVFHLYAIYPFLDIPMHLLGGVAMAYFLSSALFSASIISGAFANRFMTNLLVFTATCTVAVFWEFSEFIVSWILSKDLQGGLADTMKDLFFGIVGSICYIAVASRSFRDSRVPNWEFRGGTLKAEQ